MSTDTRRRVKLYALNAERQWDDRGTGHVTSVYVERLKGTSLVVRAESDGSLLLESKIQPDTAYQKQQETLIVWSEGDNYDLALSFQERAGCDEIWTKICEVQGKDPSVDITQEIVEEDDSDRFDDAPETTSFSVEFPSCELDRLDEINDIITGCIPFPFKREKLALALESDSYIKKLLSLFRTAESSQNLKALHKLFEIFKNIFLLNKNPLFEVMLSEESLFDVLGIFEYDPSSTTGPKRHRDYLKSVSRFKEVIPFGNQELINKIHQTYRVQYIQDVVLPTPSVFEENMLSTLSSFIFFNKVEIVSLIQEDEKFLRTLFAQITSDNSNSSSNSNSASSTSPENNNQTPGIIHTSRKKDLVLFLKEFCTFSQTLQPQNRDNFFKALSSLGVLQTLEVILASDDMTIKTAAVDILTYVVEFSPSMVREYALQQDQYIVNVIIDQMIADPDPDLGMAVQLSSILRLLLDPENMMATSVVNKSEKSDFLNFFYKNCMNVLVAPVLTNTSEGIPKNEDSQNAQLLYLILELLSFCVEHHNYHIRSFVIQKELLKRILVLMKSKHIFLVLSSLRFFRKIIGLKDEFYNRHIISLNLFGPVVESLLANNGRYNLLDSAIVEVFEFIRTEEIKSLCIHIVDKFGRDLEKVDYVRTFKGLKLQFEQHNDRLKDHRDSALNNSPILMHSKFRRDPRDLDEDEECWFDRDEDDDDVIDPSMDHNCYKFDTDLTDDFPSAKSTKKSPTISLGSYNSLTENNVVNNSSSNKSVVSSVTSSSLPVVNSNSRSITNSNSPGNNNISRKSPNSPSPPADVQTTTRKGGLVDYPDEDSEEEEEDDEDADDENEVSAGSSPKRLKLTTSSS